MQNFKGPRRPDDEEEEAADEFKEVKIGGNNHK